MAKKTAKVVDQVTEADFVPRRQTRSFASSLQAFSANGVSLQQTEKLESKQEDSSDEDSPLSSAASVASFDIEDLGIKISPSKKRKRGADTPATRATTVSTVNSTGKSSRKATGDSAGRKPKKAKRQPAKQIVSQSGEVEIRPPANWEEIYDAVRQMREKVLAPVDTMGCETLSENHLTPRDKRFQTLIALMLSSQTKDTTNAIAMRRLQTELLHPGLTLENILSVDPVKLNEMIYVVGFHNNKTRYIKAAALILRDRFDGDIPDTIEGLMSLPGVGPKMAYLCMSAAWGRTEGIGVDVHVHRITNLWGWHKTKAPEETRAALEAWLPRERWHEINRLLVGFGQTICLPVARKCDECALSKGLCPSVVVQKQVVKKRVKKQTVKAEDGLGQAESMEKTVVVKEEEKTADDIK